MSDTYTEGWVRLAELNEHLAYLQARDNPHDSEEFVRLYQERRPLLKGLAVKAE